MKSFEHPEAAAALFERLQAHTNLDLARFFSEAFQNNADPDLAAKNLERWLESTANPRLHLEQLAGLPHLGQVLVLLLGASQPLADSLIQNPELASIILEPGELHRPLVRSRVVDEGKSLLQSATSPSHALDRIRFLKQRWNLAIVLNDLTGHWAQETVWRALSDLADALIELAWSAVWTELARQRGLPHACPVSVIGFGKLGGHELNYSSDVDLVYVLDDGVDEKLERDCTRFCETLGRALSDKMGRGSLYRVDLRLRPYGGTGPILRTMRSYEAYYSLYAEPWEVQALLRSRLIVGSVSDRWEAMRNQHCFRPQLGEHVLEQMVSMRQRIEDHADEDDLKRGAGGIRDAEFLTQLLQMLHGHGNPELRIRPTCDALRMLDQCGILDHSVASSLVEGYTFLRKLEHRTQLAGDRQTHSIPSSKEARSSLAKLMELPNWESLRSALSAHRRTIQSLYRSTLSLEPPAQDVRGKVLEQLGALAAAGAHWFDLLPESEAFYQGLAENEGSLKRVETILREAPRLVTYFKSSVPLTEMLFSGEIEEEIDLPSRIRALPATAPLDQVALAAKSAFVVAVSRWTLNQDMDIGGELSRLVDAYIEHCAHRLYVVFDILALGSYGNRELSPGSDADLLFLVGDPSQHQEAESQAQQLLSLLSQLKRLGSPFDVDLRLRPEGRKGFLVRTYDALRSYDFEGMEMWERFALGHARLVSGDPLALNIVHRIAYNLPLTPERLKELTRMKKRVESERVQPQHLKRQVKLGHGGLNDIEWLVHLHEMRFPTATHSGTVNEMPERIRLLGRAHLLNALEVENLLEAYAHLLAVRNRIFLLGLSEDLVPENPEKLSRLARSCGYEDGNAFLSRHEPIVEAVRRMFLEGLERLKA